MTLVPNWRRVLTHAWSAYCFYILFALSLAEIVLPAFEDALGLPPIVFRLVYAFVAALGAILRIKAQRSVSGGAS